MSLLNSHALLVNDGFDSLSIEICGFAQLSGPRGPLSSAYHPQINSCGYPHFLPIIFPHGYPRISLAIPFGEKFCISWNS